MKERIVGINPLHSEPKYVMWGPGAGQSVIVERTSRAALDPRMPVLLLTPMDPAALPALGAYLNNLPSGPYREDVRRTYEAFMAWRNAHVHGSIPDPTKRPTLISKA